MAEPLRPVAPEKALYYVQGRQVWQRAVGGTMAFQICTAAQFVEGAAEAIAEAMNATAASQPLDDARDDIAALKAKADELDKLAAMLGSADDPFAAWESLALIMTQHGAMRACLIEARAKLANAPSRNPARLGTDTDYRHAAAEITTLLDETPELDVSRG